MKCGDYSLRIGQLVILYSVDQKKKLGVGRYAGFKRVNLFGPCNMPKFRLGRRVIYGSQCWWIPVSATKNCPDPEVHKKKMVGRKP